MKKHQSQKNNPSLSFLLALKKLEILKKQSKNLEEDFAEIHNLLVKSFGSNEKIINTEYRDDKTFSNRRDQVLNIITNNQAVSAAQVRELLEQKYNISTSQSSIVARINELVKANMVEVVGITIGKYGKKVSLYSVSKGRK